MWALGLCVCVSVSTHACAYHLVCVSVCLRAHACACLNSQVFLWPVALLLCCTSMLYLSALPACAASMRCCCALPLCAAIMHAPILHACSNPACYNHACLHALCSPCASCDGLQPPPPPHPRPPKRTRAGTEIDASQVDEIVEAQGWLSKNAEYNWY